MLRVSVQLSRQHKTDGHAVRHQSAIAKRLRSAGAGARLFRQLRSIRRLRSDLRRGQTESKNHRDADPLQGAYLRRDPDFPISRRLAAVENGVVRLSQTQSRLISGLAIAGSASYLDQRQVIHRAQWEKKKAIPLLYRDFHRQLHDTSPEGRVLDIGSGTAHIKHFRPDIISTDIFLFPGIAVVADPHP